MGIKGLMPFIRKNAPSSIKTASMDSLRGRTIAIDASMTIYQFLVAVRQGGFGLTDLEGNTTSHLQGILTRATRFVKAGIRPIFVFDGKPPEMKSGELLKRKQRKEEAEAKLVVAKETGNEEDIAKYSKQTMRMDRSMIQDCQTLLELLGIPYLEAPSEAEAQCASLVKEGTAYCTATEDMDALAFGTPILLRGMTMNNKSDWEMFTVDRAALLEELGLSDAEFIDFCILCGCDYCDTIQGIGPKRAFEAIKTYHCIENFLPTIDTTKHRIPENFDYISARQLFNTHEVTSGFTPKRKRPNQEGLMEFMVTQKNFDAARIESVAAILTKSLKEGQQLRMESFFSIVPSTKSKAKSKAPPSKAKPRRK